MDNEGIGKGKSACGIEYEFRWDGLVGHNKGWTGFGEGIKGVKINSHRERKWDGLVGINKGLKGFGEGIKGMIRKQTLTRERKPYTTFVPTLYWSCSIFFFEQTIKEEVDLAS